VGWIDLLLPLIRSVLNCGPAVIVRKLGKLDEVPSHQIEGEISFKVASVQGDESHNVLQAHDAVTGANKQLDNVTSGSAVLDTVQQVVNSANVEAAIVSVANPWLPLLANLDLFVKAVHAVAEVRLYPYPFLVDCE
jgi:hypothetical protein